MREIRWIGGSLDDFRAMPEEVRQEFGHGLFLAQAGERAPGAKTLKGFGAPVVELIERFDGDTYRAVYTVSIGTAVYVLHCFQKKSPRDGELPKPDKRTIEARFQQAKRDAQGDET